MNKSLSTILLLITVISCNSIYDNSIDSLIQISPDVAGLNDYMFTDAFKKIKIIPLETTQDHENSPFTKVVLNDDIIVALQLTPGANSVTIFNSNGEYIRSLEKGAQIGAFKFVTDIAINNQEGTIEVLDRYKIIKKYNFQGEFIDSVLFNSKEIKFRFRNLSDGSYMFYTPGTGDNLDFLIFEKGLDFHYGLKRPLSLMHYGNINAENFYYDGYDNFFYHTFVDTIYKVKNSVAIPVYHLNFEEKGIDNQKLNTIISREEQRNLIQEFNKSIYLRGPFLKNNNTLLFRIFGEIGNSLCLYNLDNSRCILIRKLLDNIGNEFPIYPGPIGYYKNKVIFSISASRLLETYYPIFEKNDESWREFQSFYPDLAKIVIDGRITEGLILIMCELSNSKIK